VLPFVLLKSKVTIKNGYFLTTGKRSHFA